MEKSFYRKGFSFFELLITAAIVIALTGIAVQVYRGQDDDSRYYVMKVNLRTLRKALMEYHADFGTYPAQLEFLAKPELDPGNPTKAKYLLETPIDPMNKTIVNWGYQLDPPSSYKLASMYDSL